MALGSLMPALWARGAPPGKSSEEMISECVLKEQREVSQAERKQPLPKHDGVKQPSPACSGIPIKQLGDRGQEEKGAGPGGAPNAMPRSGDFRQAPGRS